MSPSLEINMANTSQPTQQSSFSVSLFLIGNQYDQHVTTEITVFVFCQSLPYWKSIWPTRHNRDNSLRFLSVSSLLEISMTNTAQPRQQSSFSLSLFIIGNQYDQHGTTETTVFVFSQSLHYWKSVWPTRHNRDNSLRFLSVSSLLEISMTNTAQPRQ